MFSAATASAQTQQAPKHITIFVRAFDGSGGAERNMLNLGIGLAARGHRVDLVMARYTGHYLDLIPPEIRVVDLNVTSARQSLSIIFRLGRDAWFWATMVLARKPHYVLGALPGLAEYLRNNRPDALISAMDYPNVVAVVARELAKVKTKVIISVRNTLSEEVARSTKRRVKDQVIVDKRFYPRADHVVAVSKGVAQDLAQTIDMHIERIKTIYNPIVTGYLLTQAEEPVEHPWFNGDGPPVVLAVGGFKPAKDHATLLAAFAQARKHRPIRLLLLGEGRLREHIKNQAEQLGIIEDVDMPGFVENPFKYMANASVFVLSSVFEGLPSVLIQSMACGCPVVSTDCPSGPNEILDHGRYGDLVPIGDVQALAAAIMRALDAPLTKAELIERGRTFSLAQATDMYLSLIEGVK